MKNIIVFLLLMTLSGCGFVFQNFDQGEHKGLTYGMTKEANILKYRKSEKSRSTMVADNKEYEVWEYPNNNRSNIEKMSAYCRFILFKSIFS